MFQNHAASNSRLASVLHNIRAVKSIGTWELGSQKISALPNLSIKAFSHNEIMIALEFLRKEKICLTLLFTDHYSG